MSVMTKMAINALMVFNLYYKRPLKSLRTVCNSRLLAAVTENIHNSGSTSSMIILMALKLHAQSVHANTSRALVQVTLIFL